MLTKRVVHGGMEILDGDIIVQGLYGIYTGGDSSIGGTFQAVGASRFFSTVQIDDKITQTAGGIELNDNSSQLTYSDDIFRIKLGAVGNENYMRFTDTDGLALTGNNPRLGLNNANPTVMMDVIPLNAEPVFFRTRSAQVNNNFDLIMRHNNTQPAYEIGLTFETNPNTTAVMESGIVFHRGGGGGFGSYVGIVVGLEEWFRIDTSGIVNVGRSHASNADWHLYVNNQSRDYGQVARFYSPQSYTAIIEVASRTNYDAAIQFTESSTPKWMIGSDESGTSFNIQQNPSGTPGAAAFTAFDKMRMRANYTEFNTPTGQFQTLYVNSLDRGSSIMIKAGAGYDSYIAFRESNTTEGLVGYDSSTGRVKLTSGSNFTTTGAIEIDASNEVYLSALAGSGTQLIGVDTTGKIILDPGDYHETDVNVSNSPVNLVFNRSITSNFDYMNCYYENSTFFGSYRHTYNVDLDGIESQGKTKQVTIYARLRMSGISTANITLNIRSNSNNTIASYATSNGLGSDRSEYVAFILYWDTSYWYLISMYESIDRAI